MRGQVQRQQAMFVAFNIEQRVPEDHPLRAIKRWCDKVLAGMSRDFNNAYGDTATSASRQNHSSKHNSCARSTRSRPSDDFAKRASSTSSTAGSSTGRSKNRCGRPKHSA